ncbi:MAG: glycosyltransferase family 9 protein [Bacteroidota bacterium]
MKILVIQTAFTGDAILATSLLEEVHGAFPEAELHVLVRKGNDTLFVHHPFIRKALVWDKKVGKWKNWFRLLSEIRNQQYDRVINLQRFASTGLLTALSGSPIRCGFDKNPLSLFFNEKIKHRIATGTHETDRNHELVKAWTGRTVCRPKLYPAKEDLSTISKFQQTAYVCMAPGSVWDTKMWPEEKWVDLIRLYHSRFPNTVVYLLGAPSETTLCQRIVKACGNPSAQDLSGKLSLLQSAALMAGATMNYVNDSAPMHLASAMDAPVTAVYCSTLPSFGFGPLSSNSKIVEVNTALSCRPCGLHGKKSCPEGHFRCGYDIDAENVI